MGNIQIGQEIGRYKIVERLGQGGMAEVFKGYQAHLDRFVAIKVMHPNLVAEKGFIKRFQREARAMAALSHPNIVRIFDFDIHDKNNYYLVMEYIHGKTLKETIEEINIDGQGLPLETAVQISIQIAEALAYAHQFQMIHRDIKPGNVIIEDRTGNALLTDFGIVKLIGDQTLMQTMTGALIGTPAYMSPEQAMGKPGDERVDIYSFGVMIFQMVTGKLPFEADTPFAIVLKHVNDLPPAPIDFNPDVSSDLQEIILKALAKNPDDRYQSAAELADALKSVQLSPDVRPEPTPITETVNEKIEIESQTAAAETNAPEKSSLPLPETQTSQGNIFANIPIPYYLAGLAVIVVIGFLIFSNINRENNDPNDNLISEISPPPITPTDESLNIGLTPSQTEGNVENPPIIPTETIPPTSTSTATVANTLTPTTTPTSTPTVPSPTPTLTPDPAIRPINPVAGTTWVRPIDDMVMVYVPEGVFTMGSPPELEGAAADEKPQHEVSVAGFWLDQTDVTNSQFAQFVAETNYITSAETENRGRVRLDVGWRWVDDADWLHPNGPDTTIDGLENHPVVQVTWDDANAYCAWVDGQLPTESQWEYAARGSEGNIYPWGNEFDGTLLNFCDASCLLDHRNEEFDDGFNQTSPVGSYPEGVSWIGVLDMVGNVWNWTMSPYAAYPGSEDENDESFSRDRVVTRGGAWTNRITESTATFREPILPTSPFSHVGFRCVSSE